MYLNSILYAAAENAPGFICAVWRMLKILRLLLKQRLLKAALLPNVPVGEPEINSVQATGTVNK